MPIRIVLATLYPLYIPWVAFWLVVIGCSCYTCLPRTTPATAQTGRKTAAPGTGTDAPPVA